MILWGLGFPVRGCFGKNTKPRPEGENPQKLPLPFYLLVIQMGVGASLPSVPRVPSAWIPALPCGRVKHCFFSFSEVLCCLFKAMSYFFSTFFSPFRWLNSLWQEPWPLFFFSFYKFCTQHIVSTQLMLIVCVSIFIKAVIEKYLLFLSCLPDLVVKSISFLDSWSLSKTFVMGPWQERMLSVKFL